MGDTMTKVTLSARDRFSLYAHLNVLPVTGRQEQRQADRLWTSLKLDEIGNICNSQKETRSSDFSNDKQDYEVTSDQRDYLIDAFEKPMTMSLSRLLFPIAEALRKSRDG
jgi:hypothetical protein